MKNKLKKIGIVTVILLILTPLVLQTSAVTVPDGFYFHPDLTTDAVLEWQLKKNAFNFEGLEDVDYDIVAGVEWGVGSVFKMVLTQDLNDLPLTNPEELFTYSGDWAEFYLDDVLITENSTDIEFFDYTTGMLYGTFAGGIFPFILPLTYVYGSTNSSFFELFYTELKANEISEEPEPGVEIYYTVELTEKKLEVNSGVNMKLSEGGITITGDITLDIVYDALDGVLEEIKIYMKVSAMGFTIKYNFLLQNITSPNNLAFEWVTGLVAFFGIGVIVVALKKRR